MTYLHAHTSTAYLQIYQCVITTIPPESPLHESTGSNRAQFQNGSYSMENSICSHADEHSLSTGYDMTISRMLVSTQLLLAHMTGQTKQLYYKQKCHATTESSTLLCKLDSSRTNTNISQPSPDNSQSCEESPMNVSRSFDKDSYKSIDNMPIEVK